jgi:hypothetical protein
LSFFDDGDDPRTAVRSPRPQPRRPAPRSRGSRADDRTLLVRRGAAAAIVLIVLIGIVLGVKSILDHQALAGLKTYNDEVTSLTANELSTVRDPFFHDIDNAFYSSSPIEVATALEQLASQEQSYYRQAQGWTVPSQMIPAQRWFVGALGLRSEALADIASQMQKALGVSHGQGAAITQISGDMEKLLSADVLYEDRVAPLILQGLANAGVAGSPPPDAFLPDIGWLVPQTTALRILSYVPTSLGGTPLPAGTLVGHKLISVGVLQPDDSVTPLQSSNVNKLAYTTAGITFVLGFQNSGTVTEHDVGTQITFSKAGLNTTCLTRTNITRTTSPGATYNSTILFTPTCANLPAYFNQVFAMTAQVDPVSGETEVKNNDLTFDVEFTN